MQHLAPGTRWGQIYRIDIQGKNDGRYTCRNHLGTKYGYIVYIYFFMCVYVYKHKGFSNRCRSLHMPGRLCALSSIERAAWDSLGDGIYLYKIYTQTYMDIHMYLYLYMYIYVYIYIYTYIYIYICTYVQYMYICIYFYLCICIHVYMYICIYVYMFMNFHTTPPRTPSWVKHVIQSSTLRIIMMAFVWSAQFVWILIRHQTNLINY